MHILNARFDPVAHVFSLSDVDGNGVYNRPPDIPTANKLVRIIVVSRARAEQVLGQNNTDLNGNLEISVEIAGNPSTPIAFDNGPGTTPSAPFTVGDVTAGNT